MPILEGLRLTFLIVNFDAFDKRVRIIKKALEKTKSLEEAIASASKPLTTAVTDAKNTANAAANAAGGGAGKGCRTACNRKSKIADF